MKGRVVPGLSYTASIRAPRAVIPAPYQGLELCRRRLAFEVRENPENDSTATTYSSTSTIRTPLSIGLGRSSMECSEGIVNDIIGPESVFHI